MSHFPSTTFCWFPPESWLTIANMPGALMRSASNCDFTCASRDSWSSRPRRVNRGSVARVMFSAIDASSTSP